MHQETQTFILFFYSSLNFFHGQGKPKLGVRGPTNLSQHLQTMSLEDVL